MDAVKGRRAEYAEQTRAALVTAAAQAFAERGFAAVSITQIAAAARATKGAVYHHFSDKQALFEAVVGWHNELAQKRVYAAIARYPDDVWAAAMAGLDATLRVGADPIAGRLIYLEGPVGLGWRRWRELEQQYTHRNVRQMLQSGIRGDLFADDIPTEAMTQIIAGMITHAGIALAEAPARQRTRLRSHLLAAISKVLQGLTRGV